MSTAHTFRESLYSTHGTSRTQASPLRGAEVFGSEVTIRFDDAQLRCRDSRIAVAGTVCGK